MIKLSLKVKFEKIYFHEMFDENRQTAGGNLCKTAEMRQLKIEINNFITACGNR